MEPRKFVFTNRIGNELKNNNLHMENHLQIVIKAVH